VKPTLIFDNDCIRNNQGQVKCWIYGDNFYSLSGKHNDWFEALLYEYTCNGIRGLMGVMFNAFKEFLLEKTLLRE
jgi:hypothetical protein